MSKAVKEENVITTLVNATANGQEARELTEHTGRCCKPILRKEYYEGP